MHTITAQQALKAWNNDENVYLFGQLVEKVAVYPDRLVVQLETGIWKIVYFDTNATMTGHQFTADVIY
jgi:hypothetical protein